jgi:cytochrome c-type protein NapB
MKPTQLWKIGLLLCTTMLTGSVFAEATSEAELGLQKGSVFEIPIPPIPFFPQTTPGTNDFFARAHSGEPPQIPHGIDEFMPIRIDNNGCVRCHDKPMLIGKVRGRKGFATPAPASHYQDWRYGSTETTRKLQGSRYLCVQCHRPQADAPALVDNTFSN